MTSQVQAMLNSGLWALLFIAWVAAYSALEAGNRRVAVMIAVFVIAPLLVACVMFTVYLIAGPSCG